MLGAQDLGGDQGIDLGHDGLVDHEAGFVSDPMEAVAVDQAQPHGRVHAREPISRVESVEKQDACGVLGALQAHLQLERGLGFQIQDRLLGRHHVRAGGADARVHRQRELKELPVEEAVPVLGRCDRADDTRSRQACQVGAGSE
ncbi:hypothetical protein ACFQNE_05090 [Gordonia phosphorivorans]|uniref:hypothetical protein n=1 Tax=Gordonia phosphorivorans TaxID=1056982 RepID=UPI003618723C